MHGGPRAANTQIEVRSGGHKVRVQDRQLSLADSEAWLGTAIRGSFDGVLSFSCLTGPESADQRALVVQAIDTRAREGVQLSMAMVRTRSGRYKAIDGNAEFDGIGEFVWDPVPSEALPGAFANGSTKPILCGSCRYWPKPGEVNCDNCGGALSEETIEANRYNYAQ